MKGQANPNAFVKYWWVLLIVAFILAAAIFFLNPFAAKPVYKSCNFPEGIACSDYSLDHSMQAHVKLSVRGSKSLTVTGVACSAQETVSSFSSANVFLENRAEAVVTGSGVQCYDQNGNPAQKGDYRGNLFLKVIDSQGTERVIEGSISWPAQ